MALDLAQLRGWRLALDLAPGLIALPEGRTLLGRDPACGAQVAHPSVSRRHLAFHVAGERIDVEDLGSANGTLLGDRRLPPGERVPLRDGDALLVGSAHALVRGPAEPPDAAAGGTAIERLHALVDRVAVGTIPVTLLGETGVGKEVIAERIHARSPRRDQPFVRINCAAVPELLLESELFGYERGAFTGAVRSKPGLFEAADGGTLLLDEVGELPAGAQAKLLRALDRREVHRVGAVRPRAVDVRLIAATARDLHALQLAGGFRPDLYFRLCGVVLEVPPLRDRLDEVSTLAREFIEESSRQLGRPPPALDHAALRLLRAWSWPGNVRELRHVIDAAVLLADERRIGPAQLPARIRAGAEPPPGPGLRGEVALVERQRILEALEACGGNQSAAARALGISRRTVISRIEAWGLPRPRKR